MTNTVAQTILSQIGGNRALAMMGAKDLVSSENSLRFKLGRGAKDGIQYLTIRLGASDTYTIEATKFNARSLKITKIAEQSDVFCDRLPGVIERMTGFYLKF